VTPDVGQVTVTTRGEPLTATVADPEALTAFESVTVKLSVFSPFELSVLLKVPVPVYGAVPPVAVTVQLKGTPTEAFAGQDTVTTSGCAPTLTLADAVALALFASVTVNDSVLLPLVGSVLLIEPTPVYGPVPPVAETVHVNGFPAVTPELGHVAVTTRGWPPTVTLAVAVAVTPFASLTVNDSVLVPLEFSVLEIVPVPV